MPTMRDLQARRRELLDDLEQINTMLERVTDPLSEDSIEQREHRAWLQRQQAGALVMLQETERALLEFDEHDEKNSSES